VCYWLGASFLAALVALGAMGCGSGQTSGRPDIDAIPDDVHFGTASKSLLYEFRAKVRKRGVAAAQQDLPQVLEAFEGYELRKLGEHTATYKEIVDKLKALQGSLASANRDAVVKAADEIGALADKLPGTANPNPEVE
jgi:hypothetical protein